MIPKIYIKFIGSCAFLSLAVLYTKYSILLLDFFKWNICTFTKLKVIGIITKECQPDTQKQGNQAK